MPKWYSLSLKEKQSLRTAENENRRQSLAGGSTNNLNQYEKIFTLRHKDKKFFSKNRKKLCKLKIFLLPLRKD